MKNPPKKRKSPPRRAGFALVLALTTVILVTILVLAFFSKAILNRQISFTSTNQIKSDMLARSALDIVIGEVRQEIIDYSDPPVNGIYRPVTNGPVPNANIVPITSGVSGADTNAGAFTIAKVAAANEKINPGPNGVSLGSSIALNARSRNGRTLSQWFASGPQLGTADLPSWVYLSRSGGVVANLSAGATNASNTNFVTGRFSYTVYNTGGLLDANVAGYPSTISATNYRSKSSTAYADLTALGLSTSQIDSFVTWRNAGTGGSTNTSLFNTWATGVAATNTTPIQQAAAAAASGYLETAAGDNAFFSRRDLLRYLGARATTNAATSLTHFTRSLTAPTWGPSNVTNSVILYGNNADSTNSINRFVPGVAAFNGTITDYADDGLPTPRAVSDTESLVQRKFSLAKLAWIGHDGPNAAAFDPSLDVTARELAIKTCFGLTWRPSGSISGLASSDAHWEYNHGDPDDILTLDEVRLARRAPDFFELLKAGILRGSLGQQPGSVAGNLATATNANDNWQGPNGRDFQAYSADEDRHILQIGANIIDQADRNNFPTAIRMNLIMNKYTGTERDFFNTVFGLENLPMLQRVGLINAMPQDWDSEDLKVPTFQLAGPMWFWMQPELWNPNDRSTAGSSPATTETYPTPSSLRLTTYGRVFFWNRGENPFDITTAGPLQDFGTAYYNPIQDGIICFKNPAPNSASPRNLFDAPVRIMGHEKATLDRRYYDDNDPLFSGAQFLSGAKNRYPENVGWVTPSQFNNQFVAVWLGECERNTAPPNEGYDLVPVVDTNLTFVLEYYDGGSWRPYCSFSRMGSMTRNDGARGSRFGASGPRAYYAHPDPRTERFSNSAGRRTDGQIPQWGDGFSIRPVLNSNVGIGEPTGGGRSPIAFGWPRENAGIVTNEPPTQMAFTHSPVDADGPKYLFDDWAINLAVPKDGKPASQFRYSDPDGATRPGDAWRADYTTGDGVGMYIESTFPTTAQRRRSVILNRPFLSVGELGYVYRDVPFKSLDLWSADSPDAGLLDLFEVSDKRNAVAAGKVNPGVATPAVLTALFSGAGNQAMTTNTISSTIIPELAQSVGAGVATGGPLGNPSDLVSKLSDTTFAALTPNPSDTLYRNKSFGEAPLRALSSVSSMRSWTLLIDVVAQSGKLAATVTGLEDFIVEGEKRYWLHVTIDRFTGEIVDKQLESVYE